MIEANQFANTTRVTLHCHFVVNFSHLRTEENNKTMTFTVFGDWKNYNAVPGQAFGGDTEYQQMMIQKAGEGRGGTGW